MVIQWAIHLWQLQPLRGNYEPYLPTCAQREGIACFHRVYNYSTVITLMICPPYLFVPPPPPPPPTFPRKKPYFTYSNQFVHQIRKYYLYLYGPELLIDFLRAFQLVCCQYLIVAMTKVEGLALLEGQHCSHSPQCFRCQDACCGGL